MKFKRQVWLLAMVMLSGLGLAAGVWKCLEHRAENGNMKEVSVCQEYMEPKVVALTFDDGPNNKYTEKLLDGLKERDVKATFFLVGESIGGNEATVKRMWEEGHLIGVHCMEHTDLTKEPMTDAIKQLADTGKMIEEITGKLPEYVRPPYGNWNTSLDEQVAEQLSMAPVFWSVDSTDWKLKNTSRIVKQVIRDTDDGDIILMHDEFSTSVEAAFQIIDNLLANGYTFVTVDELTID